MHTEIRPSKIRDSSVAGMIAAQPPDALALAANSFRMTFGQLNERATGLAQGLRLLGVGPDVPIGVFAHRTPAGILGALAVLKAGAGYVPLDPANPEERLAYMLRDAQPPFVLAERGIANRLPKGSWKVVPLDETPLIFSKPMDPLPPPAPSHLAYICYTSGSMGKPLGVEVTHASLLNLIRWHHKAFRVTPSDNASQLAGPGFDTAVWEIWPYLTAGASLHFPDETTRRAAVTLRQWLLDEYITIAFAPTAMAEQLIALDWPASSSALRLLLTGGEVLRQHPPGSLPFTLVNTYGPAEATVVATSVPVLPQANPLEFPPIGRPIDNVRIAILNHGREPVRDGQPGELCIGGAGLARGYLNQAELTARKFVSDPTLLDRNARLYRTGDLVRRLPNGQIAYVGRVDDQVKICGCRVEPAEIESVLNSYPDIQNSVAIVREEATGDRRMAAYVVPAAGASPSMAGLEEVLRKNLPEYMVPAGIVAVAELPLTWDGKVDRSALPEPLRDGGLPVRQTIAARLAQLIASLLEVESVALDDNFFHIGGHPLLGALLIDRVAQVFGVTLTPRQLFEAPTVAELAAEIERAAQLAFIK